MARWYQNFFWRLLKMFYIPGLRKKYNVEAVFHDKEPTPPFILMANHSHKSDPYMVGGYMKHTVNYMANIDGVSNFQRKLADLVGAYGKKKGAPDFKALKHTIELIKGGHAVGIFPEGDRSWDGETAEFIPGSVSMAKKYKIPIRIASLHGNYLSMPRWADFPRKGRVHIDFFTITKEEVAATETYVIESKIKSILHHDDIKSEKNKNINFEGEGFAEGIQRLLWICPACGKQDTLYGLGNDIKCSNCQNLWTLDGSLKISPIGIQGDDLKDWAVWQKQEMKKICDDQNNNLLTETKNIKLAEIVNREVVNPCVGDIQLYHDRVEFHCESCEKITFNIELVAHYIDNFNKVFEFDYDPKRYRILFEGKNASKWIFCLDYLKSGSL
ncbi:MAG: lysophospholipid acyltransferase family protein [Spirochaetaceae bacterium]|jgi:1-acyl-sn-glycerol-3-phosphate acyltransferase|nr:lysophospholipid acyltransferase family protein [Spirochaetaceae bacterium]